MNLSTSIYRICALLLFFISSPAPLYAMEQSTGPDYFSWLPKDVILIVTNLLLPEINPSFDVTKDSSDLMAKLSTAIALSKSNKRLHQLLSPEITKYKTMLNGAANACDQYGYTPLARAIENKNISAIFQLIKSGADVNMPSGDQCKVPLYIIAADEDYDEAITIQIAQILLENGADVNAPKNNPWWPTPFGKAIHSNKLNLAQLFINHGANIVLYSGPGLITPLQYAQNRNNQDAIDLITQAIENQNKETKN